MPSREYNKSTGILVTFCLVIIFVLVTCVLSFIKGQDQYKGGFVIVGAALLLLIAPTAWILNWVRKDENVEDKVKYIAIFQGICVLFLCISIMVVAFESGAPPPKIPPCNSCCNCPIPPEQCNLWDYSVIKGGGAVCGSSLPSFCWGGINHTNTVFFNVNQDDQACFNNNCQWPKNATMSQ